MNPPTDPPTRRGEPPTPGGWSALPIHPVTWEINPIRRVGGSDHDPPEPPTDPPNPPPQQEPADPPTRKAPTVAANPVPASDDVALAEIASLAARLGEEPGRNQLINEFGWGASRSTRLLNLYRDQTTEPQSGPEDTVRSASGPAVRSTEEGQSGGRPSASPSRPESGPDARSGDSPAAVDRSRSASPAHQSAQDTGRSTPVRVPDRSGQTGEPREPGPHADLPVQSALAAVDPAPRTAPGPGRTEDPAAPRSGTPWGLLSAVLAIAASAFVAIWGGWVGLGRMAGFGTVNLLPGISDGLHVNLAITLPLGIESYAAAALYVAVGGLVTGRARWFAAVSAGAALALGAFGQAAFHLLEARGVHVAPDAIVVFVSVLPVFVLGAAGVLLHLVLEERKG